MRQMIPIALILALTGCAMGNKPQGFMPPAETVKALEFTLDPTSIDQAFDKAERQQLAGRIARNLRSWGYPITAASETTDASFTHSLQARIGQIIHKNTPPGMSFTLGNSDPRALEFQKADVVPITCALASLGHPGDMVTLTGDFAVEIGLDDLVGAKSARTPMDYYVDRIGTVCLNLLLELKVDRSRQQAATAGEPTWIPEVRIEVRDKPDAALTTKVTEPSADNGVHTETTRKESDSRKQVIIHNRGVPVILEFGHERK